MIEYISYIVIPLVLAITGMALLFIKRDLFSEFTDGAKEGLQTGIHLLPSLAALVTAVSMFNASGASDFISSLISPLCVKLGIPVEIVPLLAVRPISGGASTAILNELFADFGPDSFAGRCASVIMGSSDTIIYISAVYFSSVNVKHTRHTFPAAISTMIFCIFLSCFVCRIFFGS